MSCQLPSASSVQQLGHSHLNGSAMTSSAALEYFLSRCLFRAFTRFSLACTALSTCSLRSSATTPNNSSVVICSFATARSFSLPRPYFPRFRSPALKSGSFFRKSRLFTYPPHVVAWLPLHGMWTTPLSPYKRSSSSVSLTCAFRT